MSDAKDLQNRFGFRTMPFTRELRVADRFLTQQHTAVLDHLQRTVNDRMSATLIAPAGVGKTILLRTLHEGLAEALDAHGRGPTCAHRNGPRQLGKE